MRGVRAVLLVAMFVGWPTLPRAQEVPPGNKDKAQATELADRITASIDAETSQILRGKVTYAVEFQRTVRNRPESARFTAVVHFDGRKIRWELPENKTRGYGDASGVTELIEPSRPDGKPARNDPLNYIAVIQEPGRGSDPFLFHPQYVGHGLTSFRIPELGPRITVADLLRTLGNRPDTTLTLQEENSLVKLTMTTQRVRAKFTFWLDPAAGYCVVREEKTIPPHTAPANERTTEYQRHQATGPFLATVVKQVQRSVTKDNRLEERERTEYRLVDADLNLVPDASLFTLDGLRLPHGARVWDKRTGKEYLYGIPAVQGADINAAVTQVNRAEWERQYGRVPPEVAGASTRPAWLWLVLLVPGLALVGLYGVARLRRARHQTA